MASSAPTPTILSVRAGRVAPLGPEGVPSGFVKSALAQPVRIGRLGLEGDEQADLSVHGGPDKAVYAYPATGYDAWQADFPDRAGQLVSGAFGENLTIAGLVEDDLCAGDIHAIGAARLQVCQPRQPCFKLALHFADSRMVRAMVRTGRSGWYYRVLDEGTVRAGDAVTLVDRPNPALRFTRLIAIVNGDAPSDAERTLIGGAIGIPDRFKRKFGP